MSDSKLSVSRITAWFRDHVRPLFTKTEPTEVVENLDRQASHLEELEKRCEALFPICLLGQAGVGKSTLINTLIADTDIVVPSGGGTGPLTANALRVVHGDRPRFVVTYHKDEQINRTRFIIEAELIRRAKRENKPVPSTVEEPETEEMPSRQNEAELDTEDEKSGKTQDAVGRASLLVAGAQSADRTLEYLSDALRWILGQKPRFDTTLSDDDMERLKLVKEALAYGNNGKSRSFDSLENDSFRKRLRDHAAGFLAPLILEMTIHWNSEVLRDSLELVDLPGIGILSDAYASVTSDYLRNRAKAVMMVTGPRGIQKEDAELLRSSGFLSRLLHAGADLAADPVALIIVSVKIDDVAEENHRNDKATNGSALKTKAQHFEEVVDRCRGDVVHRLDNFLREIWAGEDGGLSEGKTEVIQRIIEQVQVFPVSAPQYRLHHSDDEDEQRPFLKSIEATNIPALRDAIVAVARRCVDEQNRRREEAGQRFFGQLRARLAVLSAQQNEERRAENEMAAFRSGLDEFMQPLQREFDVRRGGFRNHLRKVVPIQIESRVGKASLTAQKEINGYLRTNIRDAHWKTLQAAVRREGTFVGSRRINLPSDFAIRFEEPVAEVWSRGILTDVRKETRDFAAYQEEAVTKVLDWAKTQGLKVSTRLLEALLDEVKQHRQQVNAVGRDAVDELRDKVREELIKEIEGPIRKRCKRFVDDNMDSGAGVRKRIIELFEELAGEVVDVASKPASDLLKERFREVDSEILKAFKEHSDPLNEAAEALAQRQEKKLSTVDPQAVAIREETERVLAVIPYGGIRNQEGQP